ncbi:hypothetical protein ACLOJK_039163 [Asimina triloba]
MAHPTSPKWADFFSFPCLKLQEATSNGYDPCPLKSSVINGHRFNGQRHMGKQLDLHYINRLFSHPKYPSPANSIPIKDPVRPAALLQVVRSLPNPDAGSLASPSTGQ